MLLKRRQRFAGVALAAALMATAMVVAASPAGAHTAQQACGSGYSVVAKPRAIKTSSGVRYGKVYLLYNSGNRQELRGRYQRAVPRGKNARRRVPEDQGQPRPLARLVA
jgi:hypothetical protein